MHHKLNTLQAGRGLAAITVLFSHIPLIYGLYPDHFNGLVVSGLRGVDFFFVLSGFIIFYTNRQSIGVPGAAPFYFYRRLVRIYPLLIVFTLVKLLYLGAGGSMPDKRPDLSYLAASTLLVPQARPPFLDVSWTLCFEMFFYLIFLVAIFSGSFMRVVCVLHAAACLFWNLTPAAPHELPASFLFSPYFLEFYMGCAIAWFYSDIKKTVRPRPAVGCLLAGGVLLAAGVAAPERLQLLLPACQPLFWSTGMGLMIFGAVPLERAGLLRVPLWLVFLGDASYSIYLAHTSIQQVLKAMLSHAGFHGPARPQMCLWLVAVLSLGLSVLVYSLIEKPMLNWFHAHGPRKNKTL